MTGAGHGRGPSLVGGALERCAPLALLCLLAATPTVGTADEIRDIDWRTSPLDLNLRGLNGERFRFRCPPGKPLPDLVIGSHPYADSSSICTAAVHAGFLHASAGGPVTIEIQPGGKGYRGTSRHYIASMSYEGPWGGSFVVVAGDAEPRPATAGAHR